MSRYKSKCIRMLLCYFPLQQARKAESVDNNDERKRYQDFQSDSRKNFHQYTPFKPKSNSAKDQGVKNEGYEYMHVSEGGRNDLQRGVKQATNHHYFILEPETKKPVDNIRRVNDEEEIQYLNPNHVYFILEPETSKLKPVDTDNQTAERNQDHIYFVLEKQPETEYMVTDLIYDANIQYLTSDDNYT